MEIYVNETDERGVPVNFCDEEGNILEDRDWNRMDILQNRNTPAGYVLCNAGYFAGNLMGVYIKVEN